MKTALAALADLGVKRLVLAVPVAPREVLQALSVDVDESICLLAPESFRAVSPYYADFDQTTDEEVIALLDSASHASSSDELHAPLTNQQPAHESTLDSRR
jgi:putative phosphoribosyl transferase